MWLRRERCDHACRGRERFGLSGPMRTGSLRLKGRPLGPRASSPQNGVSRGFKLPTAGAQDGIGIRVCFQQLRIASVVQRMRAGSPRSIGRPLGPRAASRASVKHQRARVAAACPDRAGSTPPAIRRHALLWRPHILGQRAALPEHVDGDAAARVPIAADA